MARMEDYWTAKQEEYLLTNWGHKSIPMLVRRLGKSKTAIEQKRYKMGLPPFLEASGSVSLNVLWTALGCARSQTYKLTSWVTNRGLPVYDQRVYKNTFRMVKLDEFWKWAEQHRDFIDFSQMEPNILGAEPAWVKEQRKLDAREHRKRKKSPWTLEEDAILRSMVDQYCYTYSQIAERLCRSDGAVYRRIFDLGLKGRPLRQPPHSPWQDWQKQKLPELIKRGTGYSLLSKELQKSEKAIRGYVARQYGSENLDKVRAKILEEDDHV